MVLLKKKTLVVLDPHRTDLIGPLKSIFKYYECFFIYFNTKEHDINYSQNEISNNLFWSDYDSAFDLVKQIAPEKVFFYTLESYNHHALLVACKINKIRTIHVEHGLQDLKNKVSYEESMLGTQPTVRKKVLRYDSNRFLIGTIIRSILYHPVIGINFIRFFLIRRKHTIIETFLLLNSPSLVPDKFLTFSEATFDFYRKIYKLNESYPVSFVGIPYFDYLSEMIDETGLGDNMLFIDQPFHEQNAMGWTIESKKELLTDLANVCKKCNKIFYFKPHPVTDIRIVEFVTNLTCSVIVSNTQIIDTVKKCKFILGFDSTLLVPLIALNETICFSLNNHPYSSAGNISEFLTSSGAIDSINNVADFEHVFKNFEFYYEKQKNNKKKFIKKWMNKFDGNSSERFINELINC